MLIERLIFYDSDDIEIVLPLYRSFSTLYLVIFALKFFIHRHEVRGELKSFML